MRGGRTDQTTAGRGGGNRLDDVLQRIRTSSSSRNSARWKLAHSPMIARCAVPSPVDALTSGAGPVLPGFIDIRGFKWGAGLQPCVAGCWFAAAWRAP